MELNRRPTVQEKRLIEHLVEKSFLPIPADWKEGLMVRPMDDGLMGSLYLFPQGEVLKSRKFGKQVSEFQFTDVDGVDVIASLNVDSEGNLFELDIWKTNFERLIKIPDF